MHYSGPHAFCHFSGVLFRFIFVLFLVAPKLKCGQDDHQVIEWLHYRLPSWRLLILMSMAMLLPTRRPFLFQLLCEQQWGENTCAPLKARLHQSASNHMSSFFPFFFFRVFILFIYFFQNHFIESYPCSRTQKRISVNIHAVKWMLKTEAQYHPDSLGCRIFLQLYLS